MKLYEVIAQRLKAVRQQPVKANNQVAFTPEGIAKKRKALKEIYQVMLHSDVFESTRSYAAFFQKNPDNWSDDWVMKRFDEIKKSAW